MTSADTTPAKPEAALPPQRVFLACDWRAFWIATVVAAIGYFWTLAPDITLEDSGELAVASHYAGVPHPPGYPIWTVYTWLFTKLIPFSNTAWRVSISSAVAAAFASGLVALLTASWGRRIADSLKDATPQNPQDSARIATLVGAVTGLLAAFNGYIWSQAVIVEVYTFSAVSFMATLTFLYMWSCQPDRMRWLYLSFFLFGIAFTNHQTLIVAAMGIEIFIAVIRPRLGRELLLGNSLIFLLVLLLKATGKFQGFDHNKVLFTIFVAIGIASIIGYYWLAKRTGLAPSVEKTWTEGGALGFFKRGARRLGHPFALGGLFAVSNLSNLFLPISSMTNPPMNWGYPRTLDGLIRLVGRGQYAPTSPTEDPFKFIMQIAMYWEGVFDEYSLAITVLAAVPFLLFRRLDGKQRGLLLGSVGMFLGLSALLMALLNPNTDEQSRHLTKVFFSFSHLIIAMWIGFGAILATRMLFANREEDRMPILITASVATGAALFDTTRVFGQYQYSFTRFAYLWAFLLAIAFVGAILYFNQKDKRPPLKPFLWVLAAMPIFSLSAHWSDNEQRGHLFGYWFGHDMFSPPFDEYPEMDENAILFGGTDPGRFCPTYMIFVDSVLPPSKKRDSDFDRTDTYIITQNALADDTYLSYIRAHYNRSAQIDPPFFEEALPKWLGFIAKPLDKQFTALGERVETRRRAMGVYPAKEIQIPTPLEASNAYREYVRGALGRLERGELGADEQLIPTGDGGVIPTGQGAVMRINGILAKTIFDKNPEHSFYLEESWPLEWMYPHLKPHGIILKIEREPITELTQDDLDRNHRFWRRYSERLCGDWIRYDTTIDELVQYADEYFYQRNLREFPGDAKFARDEQAQKAFSKLRGSQAELFHWRWRNTESEEEEARLEREIEFAFKQSFAYYPLSPETLSRFSQFLAQLNRFEEALKLLQVALRIDPHSDYLYGLANILRQKGVGVSSAPVDTPAATLRAMRELYESDPTDPTNSISLVRAYAGAGMTNRAMEVLDAIIANPDSGQLQITAAAELIATIFFDVPKLERALVRLTEVAPDSPEAYYDLAAIRMVSGAIETSMESLATSLDLSDARLLTDPEARDIREDLMVDRRFDAIRSLQLFRETVGGALGNP